MIQYVIIYDDVEYHPNMITELLPSKISVVRLRTCEAKTGVLQLSKMLHLSCASIQSFAFLSLTASSI